MKIVLDGMEASGLESGIAIFNATDVREKQAYLLIEDEGFEFDADSGLQYRVSGRFHGAPKLDGQLLVGNNLVAINSAEAMTFLNWLSSLCMFAFEPVKHAPQYSITTFVLDATGEPLTKLLMLARLEVGGLPKVYKLLELDLDHGTIREIPVHAYRLNGTLISARLNDIFECALNEYQHEPRDSVICGVISPEGYSHSYAFGVPPDNFHVISNRIPVTHADMEALK